MRIAQETWVQIEIKGELLPARAGMSMTNIGEMILIFGGSGPSSQFYNDIQVFDPKKSEWISIHELTHKSPPQRAGHTSTLIEGKLYFYGGSCGKEYLEEIGVLDVCPAPEIYVDKQKGVRDIILGLSEQINCKDYADVTFQIENKEFYAHKVVLACMSEHFRAMFKSGMKESREAVIDVPNVSYKSFSTLMQYFYSGKLNLDKGDSAEEKLGFLKEMLKVADQFMVEDVKLQCEEKLTEIMTIVNCLHLSEIADTYNALELKEYAQWFIKKHINHSQ
jgi:hypothetical protein